MTMSRMPATSPPPPAPWSPRGGSVGGRRGRQRDVRPVGRDPAALGRGAGRQASRARRAARCSGCAAGCRGTGRRDRRPALILGPFRDDDRHHDVDESASPPVRKIRSAHDDPDDRRVGVETSATPPATPASIRSSRDRYSRSATAILRVQRERAGVGFGPQLDLDGRRIEARRRPGRAVLDEAVAVVVVAGDDAVAGVERSAAPAGAHRPDRAGIRLDRPGHRQVRQRQAERAGVQADMSIVSISLDDARSIVADPALISSSTVRASRQRGRRWRSPAFSWTSRSSGDASGSVTRQFSRSPKDREWPARGIARADVKRRLGRADRPARRRRCPALELPGGPAGDIATVTVAADPTGGRRRRPAVNVPSLAGNASLPLSPPHAPTEKSADPAAQQPADHEPERRGDDEAADEVEPGPAEHQSDADADEDERPERPQAPDLFVGQIAGPDERAGRRRPGSGRRPSRGIHVGRAWPNGTRVAPRWHCRTSRIPR